MSVGRKHDGFRVAYGPKLVIELDATESDLDPGAIQSYKDQVDINNVMAQMARTGATEWLNHRQGTFEDVTGIDFQTCMDTLLRAQGAFDDLPSNIRNRFQNNPALFLDYVHDPANREEMYSLGLAVRPEVSVAPPVAAPAAPVAPVS